MIDPWIIILWFLSVIVYPGFLFMTSLALFTQYYARKLSARLQNRMGPSYVGPYGILQPLYDLLKLIRVKEEVLPRNAMPWMGRIAGLLGLSAAYTIPILLPLSILRLHGPYDFLVYMYLCCVWIPFMLIVMSLSYPGPYTSIGVSRMLTFMTICEPSYFAAILVPVALTSGLGDPYSVYTASTNAWRLWLNPYTLPLMILSLMAALVSLQAKSMYPPFNIPEAEQEIISGFETEFSGPVLGLGSLLHDVDVAITALSITYIILGGPYPYPHLSIPGILALIAKYLLVMFLAVLVKNLYGRFRIEQALLVMFKYSLIPALIAVTLAYIYMNV